ncbi:MAG: InlB B-repeat-containing protein [Bacteroidales bacterium]
MNIKRAKAITTIIAIIIAVTVSFISCIREPIYVHHKINLVSSPKAGVVLTGAGEYNHKASVTITATDTSNVGLIFDGWYTDQTDTTPLSKDNPYQFILKTSITLFAKFNIPNDSYIIDLQADPIEGVQSLSETLIYKEGEQASVNVVPNAGYRFLGWYNQWQNEPVSTQTTYTFTVSERLAVNNKITLIARFAPPAGKYIVKLNANPEEAALTLSGNGVYDRGTQVTVKTSPNLGYTLLGWYKPGQTSPISTQESYTFTANDALAKEQVIELTAKFSLPEGKCAVELTADPTQAVKTFTGEGVYNEGEELTVGFAANEGYIFLGWYKQGQSSPISTEEKYTFTIDKTTALTAKFITPEQQYSVELDADPTIAVTKLTGAGKYQEGERATVSFVATNGYTFVGWYKPGQNTPVSTRAEYSFTVDKTLAEGQKISLTARFNPPANQYILTLEASPAEAAIDIVGEGVYNAGQSVKLNLIPSSGYTFLGWFIKGQNTPISTNAGHTLTIDESLAVNQRINLVAKFVSITTATYNVELKADPSEAVKALKGEGIYTEGENVTINIVPNEGYTFAGWYKEGANEPISTEAEYTFAVTESLAVNNKISLTAKFIDDSSKYTVELNADPSTAVKTFTGAGIYKAGEKATISFTANKGYTFLGWYKEGADEPISTDAEYTFTIKESLNPKITIIAKFSFTPLKKYMVEIKADPKEAANTITGAQEYTDEDEAIVVVTPNSGYKFLGWYAEGGTEPLSTEFEYKFIVKESMATGSKILLTAKFIKEYTVNLVAEPAQAAQSLTGAGAYPVGTEVTLTTTAKNGYRFIGWYEVGSSNPLSQNPTYKITVNKSITIIAKFITLYTVSIINDLTASVTVTGAGEYEANTKVRVTASSNSPSVVSFVGWYEEGSSILLSSQAGYEFNVTRNIKLVPKFNVPGTYIPDPNFQKYLTDNALVDLVFTDNDRKYYNATSKGVNFTIMDISSKNIADIKGIELFTNLKELDCGYNNVTNVDLSKNTKLTYLSLEENDLTSLDISKNTALTDLYCPGNQLTSLNVSNCLQLQNLWIYENHITSLDISKNTTLGSLLCYSNQLTSLDISKNTALKDLYCYSNQLTSLDISKNTALKELYCYGNRLTSLDARNMADVDNYDLKCGRQTTNGSTARQLNLTIKSSQQKKWNTLSSSSENTNVNVTVQ